MKTELIPDLPFKFKNVEGNVWTVTESTVDCNGYGEYFASRDKDEFKSLIPARKLLMNLESGDWKIVKEENKMKKIKTTDLKGFVSYKHQPYTDYNKDIADWLTENAAQVDFTRHINLNCYIFTARDGEFYAHHHIMHFDKYYTNEEFKKWIGMTKKPTTKEKLDNLLNNEGQRVLDYLKEKNVSNTMPKLVAGKHWVVVENEGYGGIGLIPINNMIHYIKGEDGAVSTGFDSAEDVSEYIVEVREIPDDAPPTFRCAKTVWERVDEKQLAIQKELEFAKAKAERLAAHISVLESKLK